MRHSGVSVKAYLSTFVNTLSRRAILRIWLRCASSVLTISSSSAAVSVFRNTTAGSYTTIGPKIPNCACTGQATRSTNATLTSRARVLLRLIRPRDSIRSEIPYGCRHVRSASPAPATKALLAARPSRQVVNCMLIVVASVSRSRLVRARSCSSVWERQSIKAVCS